MVNDQWKEERDAALARAEAAEAEANRLRVVLHYDEQGWMRVYADDGVTVISVDDRVSEDRVFHMTPDSIPADLIQDHEPVGRTGDGSAADIRLRVGLARMEGNSPLRVVGDEEPRE